MRDKRLAIIGNADVTDDYSGFVDSCNVVIRINLRENYNMMHSTTGHKADILCYTPRAIKLVLNEDRHMRFLKTYQEHVKQVWFLRPRPGYTLNKERLIGFFLRRERFFLDMSRTFIKQIALKAERVVYVGNEFREAVIKKLSEGGHGTGEIYPSAGIMAIEKCLGEMEFAGHEKYLLGFTFQGWEGHPWHLERELVDRYVERGVLRIPSPEWL
jgi:hypothetical protein